MNMIGHDLRTAIRGLRRDPGFSTVALLTLALGIGANTAIFSVVDALLLRPLPYAEPDRLVTIWETGRGGRTLGLTAPEFLDIQARARTLEQVSAYATMSVNLSATDEPERIRIGMVSASFSSVLGVSSIAGRTFTMAEDRPGQDRVVVLGHALWQRRFGGDPSIIGRTIQMEGTTFTVVGVMQPGFAFPERETAAWIPLALDPADLAPGNRWLEVVARRRADVSIADVHRELSGIAQALPAEYRIRFPTGANVLSDVRVVTLKEMATGEQRSSLLALLGAVAFVLLIACANLANLLLARAEERRREIAIRTALGASRSSIVTHVLAESTLLALAGGGLALAAAVWGGDLLAALAPQSPIADRPIGLNTTVLGYTLGLALLTGIAMGLVPALRSSRATVTADLKVATGTVTLDRERKRYRHALVISQIALGLTLLAGAGLLLNSFLRLRRVDPGFEPENALTLQLSIPERSYGEAARVQAFYRDVLSRANSLPGVSAAATVHVLPLSGINADASFEIEGQPVGRDEAWPNADYRVVSPGYFTALGIALRSGRVFREPADTFGFRELVVSESLARQYWPGDALGKRIRLTPGDPWMMIVGIAADVHHRSLGMTPRPTLYLPHVLHTLGGPWIARTNVLVVRSRVAPQALASALRDQVRQVDPQVPVSNVRTMSDVLAASMERPQFTTLLVGIFAMLALVLTALGIYGVMAYTVSRQSREIAIRVALGASTAGVRTMVMRETLRLTVIGVGIGLAGAIATAMAARSILFEVAPGDPITLMASALSLGVVAALAGYIPARRASRTEPLALLRTEPR